MEYYNNYFFIFVGPTVSLSHNYSRVTLSFRLTANPNPNLKKIKNEKFMEQGLGPLQ